MCPENPAIDGAVGYGKDAVNLTWSRGDLGTMNKLIYNLPGFDGYSALANRQKTKAEDIKNYTVRENSLKPRNG